MAYNGRTIISVPYEEIDDSNIVAVLNDAYETHKTNKEEMEYLYKYFKGIQPIVNRTKKYNDEINNKIVENHANEITNFKTGYLLMKPIQFVARKDEVDNKQVEMLNDFMYVEGKEAKDKELANWQSIMGTALRLVVSNEEYKADDFDNAPYKLINIDPRMGFIVYSSLYDRKPLLGVVLDTRIDENGKEITYFQAYTKDAYYTMVEGADTYESKSSHTYENIPLIEYPLNSERIGDFELVLPLLDAINTIQSNRVDGVEQFIQSLMVFENVDIDSDEFQKMKDLGAIKITSKGEIKANVKYLTQELNQTQVQQLKNDMYEIVLKICGVPSTSNGTTSDSSNNGAVVLRNGWQNAETKAQETEVFFKESEKASLKVALVIARTLTRNALNLFLSNLDIKFTRRNYEDILTKKQVLIDMLKSGKVAPRLCFVVCGLFQDPESAYLESQAYIEEQSKKAETIVDSEETEKVGGNEDNEQTA